jgi:isopenicillin-N N-acyltransferase-like protein
VSDALPRFARSAVVIGEGDPFDRGAHLGATARDRVELTVRAYFSMFAHGAGLSRARALEAAEGFVESIAGFAPELLDEMRGIAAGAGRELLEIVAVNARTELLHGIGRECSSIGVSASGSPDGHVRVAQNWDWNASLAGSTVLWAIRGTDGHDVITFCEAGMVGKIGINTAGLALVVNLLRTDADHGGPAVPMHVVLRAILDRARSVDDAIALLRATPRCTSCNHVLADREGGLADVEATPDAVRSLPTPGGVVTHANHCEDAECFARDRTARESPETIARGARMRALAEAGPLDAERLVAILRDHATAPGSICLHVDPAMPESEREESIASIVLDATTGTIDLADGPPCTVPYHRIDARTLVRWP